MSETIRWECDECGKPIADGDGWVTLNYAELNAYRAAEADWEKRHPRDHGLRCVSFGELMELPEAVQWHVWHRSCDPDIDSGDYCIDIERCHTSAQLLEWTAHLLEKNWIQDTTWSGVLRRQAEQLGRAA